MTRPQRSSVVRYYPSPYSVGRWVWLAPSLVALASVALWRLGCVGAVSSTPPDAPPLPEASRVHRPELPIGVGDPSDWAIPARYSGKLVVRRAPGFTEKLIALTFDDGPDPTVTPIVLEALAKYNAHATFFVLGCQAKSHPELVSRIGYEGHALANHTYRHLGKRATRAEAALELLRTEQLIEQATGRRTSCLRPPNGYTETALVEEAKAQGYCVLTWTMSAADTHSGVLADTIAHNLMHTPVPGDIALAHDGAGHLETAKALPMVLEQLSSSGWRFVTVPQLLRAWDAWLSSQGK